VIDRVGAGANVAFPFGVGHIVFKVKQLFF
jgi:hypothetical protein